MTIFLLLNSLFVIMVYFLTLSFMNFFLNKAINSAAQFLVYFLVFHFNILRFYLFFSF